MATELLQIEIQANLQQALNNLKQLQAELGKTGKAGESVGQKSMPKLAGGVQGANVALVNFGRVVQDAPFGLIGIANNIDPLLSSFSQLKAQTGSSAAAFKALGAALLGPAGIAIGVSAVTSALIAFGPQIQRAIGGANEFTDAISKASEEQAKSAVEVFTYVTAIKQGTLTTDQLRTAQKELVKVNPEFNKAFKDGKVNVDLLNAALDSTVQKILNTIKVSAATEVLEKEFKKIADQILNSGKNLTTFQKLLAGQGGRFAGGAGRQFAEENLNRANEQLATFEKRIQEVFAKLGVNLDQIFKETGDNLNKPKKKAEELKITLDKIAEGPPNLFDIPDSDFTKLQQLQDGLEELIKTKERLSSVPAVTADLAGLREVTGGATPIEQLDLLAGEFTKVNEQAKLLQETINSGINAGIDQFFNALANNQDPFKALIQSVQRLVAELAAAVVKSLILKAVATSLGVPGADRAFPAFGGNISGGGIVRGDILRLATLGR